MRAVILLVLSVVLSGCLEEAETGVGVVCNPPYMRFGDGCCLDRNGNMVCDRDEPTTTQVSPPAAASTTVPAAPAATAPPPTQAPAATYATATTRAPTTTTSAVTVTSTTGSTSTTEPPHCNETDGGENVYVKGTTTRGKEKGVDKCAGSASLSEFYCDGNRITMRMHECPLGCAEGRCLGCEDSDGGDEPDVYGEVTLGDTLTKRDTCSNRDGVTLTEFFCADPGEVGSRQVVCPASCDGGYCS